MRKRDQQGSTPHTTILSDDEYLLELDRKLTEELEEYQQSKELEELADILEFIDAICIARNYPIEHSRHISVFVNNQYAGRICNCQKEPGR